MFTDRAISSVEGATSLRLRTARDAGHGLIWGLGAHVLKTGLSPILIDLMERGFVSALAVNGASIIQYTFNSGKNAQWQLREP